MATRDAPAIIRRVSRMGGFTLIELLVVAVLLAIFAAVSVSTVQGADEQSQLAAAQQTVRVIAGQIDVYRQVHGEWPANIDPLWFSNYKLPLNPLQPDHAHTVADDVDGSGNDRKWHPQNKTTESFPFWYNPLNGAFRIRVPSQATDAGTLELYNAANGSHVPSLASTGLVP